MTDEERTEILRVAREHIERGKMERENPDRGESEVRFSAAIPISELVAKPYEPGAWRRAEPPPRPKGCEPKLDIPPITLADVDARIAEAVEAAIEQERASTLEFMKAMNEFVEAAGEAMERVRKDIVELQAVIKRHEEHERRRFDDILPPHQRLQAH
jgi:hypothetical protein